MRRAALLITLFAAGCSIRTSGTVAKPTALEMQLLGAYQELDEELVHASSFRGQSGPRTPNEIAALKMAALRERAIQRFNEDDLLELKGLGCIAEGYFALVLVHPCEAAGTDPAVARRLSRVVREENLARNAILDWAAQELSSSGTSRQPFEQYRKQVRRAYRNLLEETASPEHLFQQGPSLFESAGTRKSKQDVP